MVEIERSPEEEAEFRAMFEKEYLPKILEMMDRCMKIGRFWD